MAPQDTGNLIFCKEPGFPCPKLYSTSQGMGIHSSDTSAQSSTSLLQPGPLIPMPVEDSFPPPASPSSSEMAHLP